MNNAFKYMSIALAVYTLFAWGGPTFPIDTPLRSPATFGEFCRKIIRGIRGESEDPHGRFMAEVKRVNEQLRDLELSHLDMAVRDSMNNFTDLDNISSFEVRDHPNDIRPSGYFSTSDYLSPRHGKVKEAVHFAFKYESQREQALQQLKREAGLEGRNLVIRVDPDKPGEVDWFRQREFKMGRKVTRKTSYRPNAPTVTLYYEMVWSP